MEPLEPPEEENSSNGCAGGAAGEGAARARRGAARCGGRALSAAPAVNRARRRASRAVLPARFARSSRGSSTGDDRGPAAWSPALTREDVERLFGPQLRRALEAERAAQHVAAPPAGMNHFCGKNRVLGGLVESVLRADGHNSAGVRTRMGAVKQMVRACA
jgi:hypothetical protein